MIKSLYIIFFALIVTNCNLKPIDKYHGVSFLEKKQKKLILNKSNKNDIVEILGAPSTESLFENNVWIYIENRKSKTSIIKLGKNIVKVNNVLVLEINKYGLLIKKDFYDINDQNNIAFNKNKTRMSEKDSFVYGVVSSLKQKIDSPKRNVKD
tara:strand:+ start:314 stop:772 length:459 start_codon:yes stop_codon:yes gene_type:complete